MLYSDLKKDLKELGYTLKQFASKLDLHENSVTNWSTSKDKKIPKQIAMIVEGMKHKKELDKFKEICKETK